MASRALPDLVARIRVDSTGVDTALLSLVSSLGKAKFAMAGLAVGIGLLVIGGKSMLDIAQKHDEAVNGLKQAVDGYNASIKISSVATADLRKEQEALKLAQEKQKIAAQEYAKVLAGGTKTVTEHITTVTGLNQAHTKSVKIHEQVAASELSIEKATLRLQEANDALARAQDTLSGAQGKGSAAAQNQAITFDRVQREVNSFINTNRAYISDQSEVIAGFATLTRAGLTQNEVQLDMNRALDIASLKHIDLGQAVDLVNAAEHGRLRGLIDLGIATTKYTDANGKLVAGSKNVQKAFQEIDARTKNGRDTLTQYQQDTNKLSNDWQDLSNKGGPVLLTLLDAIVTSVTAIYNWFDAIGKNDNLWGAISDRLVKIASWIHDWIIVPLQNFTTFMNWDFNHPSGPVSGPAAPNSSTFGGKQFRAGGGSVLPGGTYEVGEEGPETLVMGARGGTVIPSGQGRSGGVMLVVNVYGSVMTERQLGLQLRETLRNLDREQR